MDVRAATGDDVAAVTELWVALAREQRAHGSHLLDEENRERARDLVAQYVHADGCAVAEAGGVAEGRDIADGHAAGFVMFHVETGFFEMDATRGVIDNVYVVPDARGEGVGSALLDHAEARLRDRGADVFAVEALWDNEGARRLYERRGYAPHRTTLEKPAESSGVANEPADPTGEATDSTADSGPAESDTDDA
jgi:ribosomal protein S18 acetylase RimI-like enzyme